MYNKYIIHFFKLYFNIKIDLIDNISIDDLNVNLFKLTKLYKYNFINYTINIPLLEINSINENFNNLEKKDIMIFNLLPFLKKNKNIKNWRDIGLEENIELKKENKILIDELKNLNIDKIINELENKDLKKFLLNKKFNSIFLKEIDKLNNLKSRFFSNKEIEYLLNYIKYVEYNNKINIKLIQQKFKNIIYFIEIEKILKKMLKNLIKAEINSNSFFINLIKKEELSEFLTFFEDNDKIKKNKNIILFLTEKNNVEKICFNFIINSNIIKNFIYLKKNFYINIKNKKEYLNSLKIYFYFYNSFTNETYNQLLKNNFNFKEINKINNDFLNIINKDKKTLLKEIDNVINRIKNLKLGNISQIFFLNNKLNKKLNIIEIDIDFFYKKNKDKDNLKNELEKYIKKIELIIDRYDEDKEEKNKYLRYLRIILNILN